MRQLIVQIPIGEGRKVLEIARSLNATNLACFKADQLDREIEVVIICISNEKINSLIEELQSIQEMHLSFYPDDILVLTPPPAKTPDMVINVQDRSSIEIYLAGLQSVGSWRGFLGYAIAAGFLVWIGLVTDTIFLLIGAMLIAPFVGPGMNTALATARGDYQLFKRSLFRYFISLGTTIIVSALLSLVFRVNTVTDLIASISNISRVAVIIPLTAGAAGAWNLLQSEHNSLVSGAASGLLIAASLAPPAGIVGIGIVLGQWDLINSGLFQLILFIVAINFTGAIIFHFFGGINADHFRYKKGKKHFFSIILTTSFVLIIFILTFQLINSPQLERASISRNIESEVQDIINQTDYIQLVKSNIQFTRKNIKGQNTVLAILYLQKSKDTFFTDVQIKENITRQIQTSINHKHKNITPLVDVTILNSPDTKIQSE